MKTNLAVFRGDDFDYATEAVRVTAIDDPHVEIGRQVEADDTLHFMNCACGVVIMTTPLLKGERMVCFSCREFAKVQAELEKTLPSVRLPPPQTISKRGEGRVLVGLVLFCIVIAGVFGTRFIDAPPRAQAAEGPALD